MCRYVHNPEATKEDQLRGTWPIFDSRYGREHRTTGRDIFSTVNSNGRPVPT